MLVFNTIFLLNTNIILIFGGENVKYTKEIKTKKN